MLYGSHIYNSFLFLNNLDSSSLAVQAFSGAFNCTARSSSEDVLSSVAGSMENRHTVIYGRDYNPCFRDLGQKSMEEAGK